VSRPNSNRSLRLLEGVLSWKKSIDSNEVSIYEVATKLGTTRKTVYRKLEEINKYTY